MSHGSTETRMYIDKPNLHRFFKLRAQFDNLKFDIHGLLVCEPQGIFGCLAHDIRVNSWGQQEELPVVFYRRIRTFSGSVLLHSFSPGVKVIVEVGTQNKDFLSPRAIAQSTCGRAAAPSLVHVWPDFSFKHKMSQVATPTHISLNWLQSQNKYCIGRIHLSLRNVGSPVSRDRIWLILIR